MIYLMLVIFPPVGIPLFLRNDLGPSRGKRIFISFLSALWMALVIFLLSRIPVQKQKQIQADQNAIFKEEKPVENKVVRISKTQFTAASDYSKVSMIKNALNNSAGDFASVRFDDGTGFQFPGANIHVTGWYGQMDKDGNITLIRGTILIKGEDEVKIDLYPKTEVLEDLLVQKIPNDWQSDITEARVVEGNGNFYISFVFPDAYRNELTAIKEKITEIMKDPSVVHEMGKKKAGRVVVCFYGDDDKISYQERIM